MQGPSGTFALSKHTVSNVENAIGEPHVPKNRHCAAKTPQFLSFASKKANSLVGQTTPLPRGGCPQVRFKQLSNLGTL